MATDKSLVGAAGVHYVAFYLSQKEYAVGLTAPGVADVDLLATNPKTGKSVNIQVKTMTEAYVPRSRWGPYWKWRISKRLANGPPQKSLFLTFVNLSGAPDVFIVPHTDLGPFVEKYPEDPMKGPPRDFWCTIYKYKKDAPYKKPVTAYKDRWDLIAAALS